MATKNAIGGHTVIVPSADGRRWSAWPNGDKPNLGNYVDFTAQSAQDPLSVGGTWSNNTQGVGGNTAPTTGTSMRIATRTGGGGVIAMGSVAHQVNYEDSFAILPTGLTGNQRIIATVFRAAGYSPTDNHELELILGCSTAANYHRWIECLWSVGGAQDTVNQDGNFDGASFATIGTSTGLLTGGPLSADLFIAELLRASNRVRWGVLRGVGTLAALAALSASARQSTITANVIWGQDTTNGLIASLGSGTGIAAFRRSIAPDSVAASLGFTDFFAEAF